MAFALVESSSDDLVGISPSNDENNLIVTYGKGGIKIFHVFDKRCLSSFPLASRSRLVLPAIQHPNGALYSVDEAKQIHYYNLSGNSKNPSFQQQYGVSKEIKSKSKIFSLLAVGGFPDLLIVFQNGELGVIDQKFLENPHMFKLSRKDKVEVIGASVFLSPSETTNPDTHKCCVDIFLQLKGKSSEVFLEIISVGLPAKIENGDSNIKNYELLSQSSSKPFAQLKVQSPKKKQNSTRRVCSSFTIDQSSRKVSLFWDDGEWEVYSYQLGQSDEQSSNSLSLTKVFGHRVSAFTSTDSQPEDQMELSSTPKRKRKKNLVEEQSSAASSSPKPVTIVFLNSSYLGMLGQRQDESGNFSLHFTIWDTNFGTLHSSQSITSTTSDYLQLIKSRNAHFVSIALPDSIVVSPISFPEGSSLASLMGKAQNTLLYVDPATKEKLSQGPLSTYTKMELSPVITDQETGCQRFEESFFSREKREQETIMALTNPKKSSSIEAFMKIFQPFVDSIQIEGETGVFDPPKLKFITPKTDMRVYSAISGNRKKALVEQKLRSHDDPNLSFNFVQSVGKRCLAECAGNSNSGFWVPLKTLIESHYFYSRSFPTLIPMVIEHQRVDILRDCLRFIHDISEVDLVKIIQFLVQSTVNGVKFERLAQSHFKVSEDERVLSNKEIVELLLNLLLRRPVNDDFLRLALTMLKENDVIFLLLKLKERLAGESCFKIGGELTISEVIFKSPSLEHCLEWTMSLIDSHLSTLLFSKECCSLLLDISLLVQEEILISKELSTIAGHLWNLTHRKEAKFRSQGSYSIETFCV